MKWTPQSWVAMILGMILVIFFVASAIYRLVNPDIFPPEHTSSAWKEIVMAIVGGLLTWMGGQNKNE